MTVPRVLSIAGTDPSGGAGIHADLKSIGALGGYGMAAVTALVAQNTRGVSSVHVPPPEFLRAQLDAVSDDVVVDAVKLGMLHSVPLIDVVGAWLDRVRPPIVVLDPVMVATSGDRLLEPAAEDAIRALCAHVHLVTPNIPELAVLADEARALTWTEAVDQAQRFAATAGTTVLLKGGHLSGEDCPDALVTADSVFEVTGRRLPGGNTHGTGCSLSAAMATLAASGWSWPDALARAKQWLAGAIAHGPALEVGRGNGPVDHFYELRPTLPEASWTAGVWADCAVLRAEIRTCSFVIGLGTGDLDPDAFRRYLAQDAFYLSEYSRVLARASALAPTGQEQVFWARSAADAIAEEARLHREHLGDDLPAPSPVTTAYVQHLHASTATGSYAEIVAAVLPCYWVYADLGQELRAHNHPSHPYRDWLDTYADPGFAEATRRAREIADRAARDASPAQRNRMRAAFETALRHELAFFDAPVAPSPHPVIAAGDRYLLRAAPTT